MLLGNALKEGAVRSPAIESALLSFKKFIRSQIIGAIILLVCAAIAILWANSPWAESYFHLWESELSFTMGNGTFSLTLHQWVNEALMMFFFLMVGLEVKEQVLVGELSSLRHAILPVAAAIGGMIVPAILFTLINHGSEGAAGWGIPMATDIAFALGILALLGKRVPLSLKVFLAALAIADDIGAILVISLFYTEQIVIGGLALALVFFIIVLVLGRLGIYNGIIYFVLALGIWFGLYTSGIHATIAGVLLAIAVPARCLTDPKKALKRIFDRLDANRIHGHHLLHDKEQQEVVIELNEVVHDIEPPLVQLEHSLQPWVTFVVMPLFALSNAGVALSGNLLESLLNPVSMGIILGLFVGKQIGITLATWLLVKSGLASLPHGITWRQIHGVSMLAGIGFTVALFVTELAFEGNHHLVAEAKTGIIFASLISGVVGYALLRGVNIPRPTSTPKIAPALS